MTKQKKKKYIKNSSIFQNKQKKIKKENEEEKGEIKNDNKKNHHHPEMKLSRENKIDELIRIYKFISVKMSTAIDVYGKHLKRNKLEQAKTINVKRNNRKHPITQIKRFSHENEWQHKNKTIQKQN